MQPDRRRAFGLVALVAAALGGCAGSATSECLSTEVGEVCAVSENGAITFNGSGLEPGSQVSISTPDVDSPSSLFQVDETGTLVAPNGQVGFLSAVADTEFTFTVEAIDGDGEAIGGEIVIST